MDDENTTPAGGLANLAAAVAKLQAELPKIDRDRTVTVEPKDPKKPPYSYSYVTLANLTDAIMPLLAKHGLSFVAMPGAGSDGKMALRYTLMHASGEHLDGEFPISGEGGIQMIGGRITYARRYCLAAVVGIAADEDDEARLGDADAGPPRTARRAVGTSTRRPRAERVADDPNPPEPGGADDPPPAETNQASMPTPKMQQKLIMQFKDLGITDKADRLGRMSRHFGREITSIKDLSYHEGHDLISHLDGIIARQQTAADADQVQREATAG